MGPSRFALAVCLLSGAMLVGCDPGKPEPRASETSISAEPKGEDADPRAVKAEQDAITKLERVFFVTTVRSPSQPGQPVISLKLTSPVSKFGDGTVQFDNELAALSAFPALRELRMTSCLISGVGLKHLADLKELTLLELSSSPVTDAGLKALPSLPNLEAVSLGATRVTDDGISELKRHPKLKKLTFSEPGITVRSFQSFADFPSLTHLDAGGERLSDAELIAVSKVPQLQSLSFWAHDRVTDRGLESLARVSGLKSLVLSLKSLEPGAFARLRGLPNLEQVTLQGAFVTKELLSELTQWKQVKRLSLGWGKTLTDEGLGSIAKMSQLESLTLLLALGITDAGMEEVGKLTNLRELSLFGSGIGDAGIAKLSNLTQLRALNLSVASDRHVTGKSLRALSRLTELETLDLFGAKVSDEDIDVLAGFKKLKRVQLSRTAVSPEGAERLRKLLPDAEVLW